MKKPKNLYEAVIARLCIKDPTEEEIEEKASKIFGDGPDMKELEEALEAFIREIKKGA